MNNENRKFQVIMIIASMSSLDKSPAITFIRDERDAFGLYSPTPASRDRFLSLLRNRKMVYSQTLIKTARISVIYNPA